MNRENEKRQNFLMGEHVVLKGTGTYWAGNEFKAHIVDVRGDEEGERANTVKVQYRDGGFKRFPTKDFEELCVGTGDHDQSDFGTQDYEWADDQYAPAKQLDSELDDYQQQLNTCIQSKDFLGADAVKKKMIVRQTEQHQLHQQQAMLIEAVRRQNFEHADKINNKIEDILANKAAKEMTEGGKKPQPSFGEIFDKAKDRAFRGGLAGMAAMVLQVCSLMWMRTIMNYQYRNGTGLKETARALYSQGGIGRFYAGIVPALAQGPLSRFGDTAANVGMLTMLNSIDSTKDLSTPVKTLGASAAAASFRIVIMPIDTVKTMMQVEGKQGLPKLMVKIRKSPLALWHGALGASAATFAGHYPWFATYNFLDENLPKPVDQLGKLARNAGMGFCASIISDTTSNSIRVLKTYRQTSEVQVSYVKAATDIIAKDGVQGLFFRGLGTRLIANGIQGMAFSVGFKYFQEQFAAPK